ncbi:MAG: Rieske (2Fe-2S) protein, partial [Pseudomonadota bacterium]
MSDLSPVITSVERARGLPNAHYVDPAMWARERDEVLFANWSGIGFGKDALNPGDAMPVDFLGVPLLMVRDRDGTLRVFQNTCRHRGMILVTEPGPIKGAIRCPYHSWCYALNGELRATPHVGGPGQNTHNEIDRAMLGLIEVPSHVFMDVVFVNLSGTAASFDDAHADLLGRWSEFANQPMAFG